jgi:hypothetical protein
MSIPAEPKIYHIVHVDRLPSIVSDGRLWCDAEVVRRSPPGTTIGMSAIKQRRLYELTLASHARLHVGDCVPFYFCPRSIMLYLIHRANHPDLTYRGGQRPIIHLEADLEQTVLGRHKRVSAGHSRYRTRALTTSKTVATSHSWPKSIGMRSTPRTGEGTRMGSRQNS